jgi:hypothetical protein
MSAALQCAGIGVTVSRQPYQAGADADPDDSCLLLYLLLPSGFMPHLRRPGG